MARRILLADDSVTAQNMGRRILTDAGYEVVTVNNGSAALKKIAESKPDLIVLDVYMPGYGGLEVCQRVKESAETKRIPVLLTVGKLEPFKAEEARRVGADSFIIKPFEATELLTVLARLEDKIVAQPQPQKTGRFAKALAAMQQSDTGDRFGDQETGWKSRLTIPGPNAKSKTEEEAPEAGVPASRGLEPYSSDPRDSRPTGNAEQRNAEQSESVKPVEPSREFERPIPAGLPADITPEEIAAITAAAASMDGRPEPATASSEAVAEGGVAGVATSEETAPSQVAAETTSANADQSEAFAATSTSVPELVQETQVEAPAEVQAVAAEGVPEAVASIEAAKVEDQPVASDLPPVETSSVSIASEAQISEAEKRAGNDAEVMAAIDSLAPSNGQAIASLSSLPQGSNGSGHQAHGSANHGSANHGSAVPAEAALTGPRWIAEAIAVAVEESKLALDQEMDQEMERARVRVAQATEIASAAPVESPRPVAVIESAVIETAVVELAKNESATIEAATVEAATMEPVESPAVAAVASVTESVSAVSTEFVPAPADAGSVVIESSTEPTSITESATAQSPILLSPTVQEAAAAADASAAIREEAAYAAAAGFAAEAASTTIAAPPSADNRSIAPPEVEPGREAELAAAWQNWKQIRESLASPVPAAPVSEVAAAEVPVPEAPVSPANSTEDVASPVQPAELAPEFEAAASEAPEESTAIASIVDTMLAELRPKLVAEIAKKMSSEKKEKEKKKKR